MRFAKIHASLKSGAMVAATLVLLVTGQPANSTAAVLEVGFAEADITPDVANKDVWIAG